MDRQAFSKNGLLRAFRKSDFLNIKFGDQQAYRDRLLKEALLAATTDFSAPSNPLSKFYLHKRVVFKINQHSYKILERKLAWNIRLATRLRPSKRGSIVQNLKLLLSEGVAFRVYRLDIRQFYESFDKLEIYKKLDSLIYLSPHTKRLIGTLFRRHVELGGTGVPRGIPISATLSEIMMKDFDEALDNKEGVFFHSRYVDDIIVITSATENKDVFLRYLQQALPTGLTFNPSKTSYSRPIAKIGKLTPANSPKPVMGEFEYLGYRFTISNPRKNSSDTNHRKVEINISEKKVRKYKMRLSKAFYAFTKNSDWKLLKDRVKYLSNNFSVYNSNIGKKKLAGIYHSYPLVDTNASSLKALDYYLRSLVLGNQGRLRKKAAPLLNAKNKRELLSNSFTRGHATQSFVHFSPSRINEIQKCWKY